MIQQKSHEWDYGRGIRLEMYRWQSVMEGAAGWGGATHRVAITGPNIFFPSQLQRPWDPHCSIAVDITNLNASFLGFATRLASVYKAY